MESKYYNIKSVYMHEKDLITEPGDYNFICTGFWLMHFDGIDWTPFSKEEADTYISYVFTNHCFKYKSEL